MGLLDSNPFARPTPAEPDPWVKVLAAIDQLSAAIRDAPPPPAPRVQVAAPDLTDIVQAVTDLKGPASADEIARAVASVLSPSREPEPVGESLAEVAEALKLLEHRMKGVGTQAYGGGAVSLTPGGRDQLAAAFAAALVAPAVTPVVETVTAAGDTTVHTPASGKAIELEWVSAINDPDEASNPLIKVKLGATEIYRGYALAHRETFTGAADAALVVNLSGAASVAVTAHLREVNP